MKKIYFSPDFPHFLHGGDYNPEQWIDTKEVWDEDMRLMQEAHCNEMSVGIFAWSMLEPKENEYHFEWMDEILDKIYAAGGRVILATPSGARPRWMADRYPEVLRYNSRGERHQFGVRENHCYTSPYYRRKVFQMNSMLAQRYGKHPAVIGWHISNEYCGQCFCPRCQQAFRQWLKKKYKGDINALNFQWWTTFWSHRVNSFEEIDAPSPLGDDYASLVLDWRRFVSDQVTDFIKNEVAGLRTYSDLPTTVNLMYDFREYNYEVLHKEFDVISWDSYPLWHRNGGGKDNITEAAAAAREHDVFRALKQRPFLLMESTPSMVNWMSINKLKRPGMNKLASLQAVAHGSDSVQYFQWRKSRGSNEKLHGAVVDHNPTTETRVFQEVKELGIALEKIQPVLGCMPKVKVAIIEDVENRWALEVAQGFQKDDKKYYETVLTQYTELWRRGIAVDVLLSAKRDLSAYDLVIAPMLYMTDKETIANLTDYVKNGGTLISGYMLGMVNENDLCYLGGFPGEELKEVFGILNEEIDTLYPEDQNSVTYKGRSYIVKDYCERIHPAADTQVLATYNEDFYAGEPALTKHPYGKGTAYYFATRDRGDLFSDVLDTVLADCGIEGVLSDLPHGVTAHERSGEGQTYLFIENYNGHAATVTLPAPMKDLESGKTLPAGALELPPYGIKVFQR